MNLHIEINNEFYTIDQLVEEFKEASKDRRSMSYELENNEETNKEGHIEGDLIYIWPWDKVNFMSGKPVLFCQ